MLHLLATTVTTTAYTIANHTDPVHVRLPVVPIAGGGAVITGSALYKWLRSPHAAHLLVHLGRAGAEAVHNASQHR